MQAARRGTIAPVRVRSVIGLALSAALVGAAAVPASAALSLRQREVSILTPNKRPAFVVIPGNKYLFRVSYTVGGAPKIATGHTYVLSEAVSGRQREVATKNFPPDKGGAYNETYTFRVPADWTPGVYTFHYTVNARAVGQQSRSITGDRSFLVVRPTR